MEQMDNRQAAALTAPLQKEKEIHEEHTTDPATGSSVPYLYFNYLVSRPTSWDPQSLEIPLNIRLDGCIVPSSDAAEGARISYSHVIVLDGLVDDELRKEIQKILLDSDDTDGNSNITNISDRKDGVRHLPPKKWERKTADMAGAAPTWGLRPEILKGLIGVNDGFHEVKRPSTVPNAILEVQSRLVKLYPEYRIAYLPSEAIQNSRQQLESLEDQFECEEKNQAAPFKRVKLEHKNEEEAHDKDSIKDSSVDCSAILANAAAEGDTFRYHVDADPTSFPPSSWTRSFGEYFNGEPGKPLLVTLLIYIDDRWERDWGGETLFLDGTSDAGIFVRPQPGRAILMEQDVVHRVNPPSSLAGGRLRLSLVWKLAFLPQENGKERGRGLGGGAVGGGGGQQVCLARKEWKQPTSFGSAARVDAVKRQLLAEKNQKK